MFSVRELSEADYEQLLRINAESQPAVAPLDHRELRRLLGLGGFHLVAATGTDVLLGYLFSFPNESEYEGEEFLYFQQILSERFFYIDQVAVSSEHRLQGVARQLYTALFTAARDDGRHITCCEVNKSPPNPESVAFHRKLGFFQIGEQLVSDGRMVAFFTREID